MSSKLPMLILLSLALVGLQVYMYQRDVYQQIDYSRPMGDLPEYSVVDRKQMPVGLKTGPQTDDRANAVIVILCRNSDLEGVTSSVTQFERIFNSKYKYPYVYLNDKPFTEEFKEATRKLTEAPVQHGLIPTEHWSVPEWVDKRKFRQCLKRMEEENIIYGGIESYRHMCRFNSLFFFKHELLLPFDYYWRIEPDVEFFCDLPYDPFVFMRDHGKVYGFTVMLPEYIKTIPTLWQTVLSFMDQHGAMVPQRNALDMFVDRNTGDYNLCHFWSNFEIADMRFFRSPAYAAFGAHLDQTGNFFYERWGDAPVHSLAVAMLLPPERIHWFEDIGYKHPPYTNCPSNPVQQLYCRCDGSKSVSWNNKCIDRYLDLFREK